MKFLGIMFFIIAICGNVFAQQKPVMKNMSNTDTMDHSNMPGMNMKIDTLKPGKKGLKNMHMDHNNMKNMNHDTMGMNDMKMDNMQMMQ